jgi:hypothetical protein
MALENLQERHPLGKPVCRGTEDRRIWSGKIYNKWEMQRACEQGNGTVGSIKILIMWLINSSWRLTLLQGVTWVNYCAYSRRSLVWVLSGV